MRGEAAVTQAQCLKNVVVEERATDGSIARSELSTSLQLKKEIGNARLVSDDAMIWVANATMHNKPVPTTEGKNAQQHVTVSSGKRSFSFFLDSNAESETFLVELRKQVDGKSGLEAKRKKRKIRKQIADNQSTGFVPVVNSLKSPLKQKQQQSPTTTPVKRRLSDSTNSPRLAPPLPMFVSTVSEARGVQASPVKPSPPAKSPFRSPFAKKPTPPPRLASPMVSLPPMSPAVRPVATPGSAPSTGSSSLSLSSPRPREWLSPARGGAMRVRAQLTPPSMRRDSTHTPGDHSSSNASEKENTPQSNGRSGGIVNKRVRSLQRMLDDVPREEPEHTAGARPPPVRSPYFLSPPNAREMSPSRRPPSAKKLRSPSQPLGELQQNMATPSPPRKLPGSMPTLGNSLLTGSTTITAATTTTSGLPRKVTHGLLNLGNYCYMNAIIQALAAIPGFSDALQDQDFLLGVIKNHLATNSTVSLPQLASVLADWKAADPTNRLVVQDKLTQLLQQVIHGSEFVINPEPLKLVMGRKNPRFASHLQQDAHEFLLHLVNEYEKELVHAVHGVVKMAQESEATPSTPAAAPAAAAFVAAEQPPVAAPKRTSLLNFFRSESKPSDVTTPSGATGSAATPPTASATAPATSSSPPPSPAKIKEQERLVAELFPAECFRTELYRTLTCRSCGYSRRQVEQFYDFSLDLPFKDPSLKSPGREETKEPLAEPLALTGPPAKQCHCGLDAVIQGAGDARFYCCAKSSCSLRERLQAEAEEQVEVEAQVATASSSSTNTLDAPPVSQVSQGLVMAPSANRSISLNDLLKDQFKSEVLELTCEKCKDGRHATARYQVKSLPRVLVFHLKRFEVNPQTGSLYKRCDLVDAPVELFPVQNIHDGDVVEQEQEQDHDVVVKNKKYKIKSVVHHLGKTVDEGHYVADVCGPRGHWRRRNDTHETMIGEDFALRASRSQESCYMLFYVLEEREDPLNDGGDKENVATHSPPPSAGRGAGPSEVAAATAPPAMSVSPGSLVGRRRDTTPPRQVDSTVSKSLHDLL